MRLWMNVQRSSGTESIYQRAEPSCYMHVLIFVATCIEHIWFCCNISFVFTTSIHELKRVEAILSSFRKDMAFSFYKTLIRSCKIDAYECTYLSEQTINEVSYFILDIYQVIIHMTPSIIICWQQFLMDPGIHISFWSLIKMSLPYQTIFKFYFLRPTLIDSRKSLDVKSVRKVYIAYLLGSSMHDVMLYINVYMYIY